MGKKKQKVKKVNVNDLNHIKQFLDEFICETMEKGKRYKFKEVKAFKLLKMALGILAVVVQAFAYKGTKNHQVVGAMCVLYYLSTQLIDEISRWITKKSIYLTRIKGRKCYRIDTWYEKAYSNEYNLKIVRIDQAKKKSYFGMYRENKICETKKILVNKIFTKTGYLDRKKFSLILNDVFESVNQKDL